MFPVRGRLYSFLQEHANSSPDEIEGQSEMLCQEFERQKHIYSRDDAKRE